MSYIAYLIWQALEYTGIGLGRFAPYIFAIMVKSKPVKIKEED